MNVHINVLGGDLDSEINGGTIPRVDRRTVARLPRADQEGVFEWPPVDE
jgi:hypothetical protein